VSERNQQVNLKTFISFASFIRTGTIQVPSTLFFALTLKKNSTSLLYSFSTSMDSFFFSQIGVIDP
jgi:hypothetical protein